jgi:hypothetical protein
MKRSRFSEEQTKVILTRRETVTAAADEDRRQ